MGSIGQDVEVAVGGAAPAGLTAAIALAGARVPTVLIAPLSGAVDNRTTALLGGSVNALEAMGVWTRCRPHAGALRIMRIVDDTGRLFRAPEVRFDAAEIGLDAFGWNIENRHLVAALDARARELPDLIRVEDQTVAIDIRDTDVAITLASGETPTGRLL